MLKLKNIKIYVKLSIVSIIIFLTHPSVQRRVQLPRRCNAHINYMFKWVPKGERRYHQMPLTVKRLPPPKTKWNPNGNLHVIYVQYIVVLKKKDLKRPPLPYYKNEETNVPAPFFKA